MEGLHAAFTGYFFTQALSLPSINISRQLGKEQVMAWLLPSRREINPA